MIIDCEGHTGDPLVAPLRVLTAEDAYRLGAGFGTIAKQVATTPGAAYAVALVVAEDGTPNAWFFGRNPMGHNGIEISRYLSDVGFEIYHRSDPDLSLGERVEKRWRQRQRVNATMALREAEKRAGVPWSCEHCGKRFKTERGAVQHEAGCTTQPKGAAHREVGWDRRGARCSCGFVAPGRYGHNRALRAHFNEHAEADQ